MSSAPIPFPAFKGMDPERYARYFISLLEVTPTSTGHGAHLRFISPPQVHCLVCGQPGDLTIAIPTDPWEVPLGQFYYLPCKCRPDAAQSAAYATIWRAYGQWQRTANAEIGPYSYHGYRYFTYEPPPPPKDIKHSPGSIAPCPPRITPGATYYHCDKCGYDHEVTQQHSKVWGRCLNCGAEPIFLVLPR